MNLQITHFSNGNTDPNQTSMIYVPAVDLQGCTSENFKQNHWELGGNSKCHSAKPVRVLYTHNGLHDGYCQASARLLLPRLASEEAKLKAT